MRADVRDLIRRLDQAGEIAPSDLPWLVTHIANELGNLIRLSGAAVIGVLRLGDHHSIRIPKTEIERLLSENLVPALRG